MQKLVRHGIVTIMKGRGEMQIVYTCPICGEDLRCVMLTSNPPQTRYECSCGWSYTEPRVDVVKIPFPNAVNSWWGTNDACDNCSNNPKNGGTGVCNRTLGMKVTC